MIAHLRGEVLKKTDKSIIIDTGNVGYLVSVSAPILSAIEEKQAIELFIHSHIKEDSFDLYGFNTMSELSFFKKLLTINGVGPKVALEIMAVSMEKISSAILNEDEALICSIPGIGKKTAKRIIMELKDKIEVTEDHESYTPVNENTHSEAIDALIKLGYKRHQVINTIKNAPEEVIEAEEIIRYFLKNA